MVVDGLGHGIGAAEAADEAVASFHRLESVNPLDILDEAHHALRKTRGAAMSVASIDHNLGKVRFAGVGNVAAMVITPSKVHSMVSHNGIVGHSAARIQDFTYDWPQGATLAISSKAALSSRAMSYSPSSIVLCPAWLKSQPCLRSMTCSAPPSKPITRCREET